MTRMEDKKDAYRVLVRISEEQSPLRRSRYRRDDNIKEDLEEMRWECTGMIDLTQDREKWRALVKSEINNWFPQNAENFSSRRGLLAFQKGHCSMKLDLVVCRLRVHCLQY